MIIGTAGHIDHGKTSLIRALTGIDTDRLPEEKARGITLDLGFAYVDGGRLGFVDVPGHERLVHTMIAGAASIGMALLVVAADDGVMPQTREHAAILSLLGVTRGVVALTKTDLADEDRLLEVELQIAALTDWPVVPVSVVTGAGIAELRARLAAAIDDGRVSDAKAFRLAVDRSFTVAGAGTVVTGSVVSGAVRTGDTVDILPGGLRARVRAIHAANQAVAQAGTGERCALNLAGAGIGKDMVGRGDWVVGPSGNHVSRRCDVTVRLLDTERSALKHWTPVLVHHGAGMIAARVVLLDPPVLAPGGEGIAQLILQREAPFRHGDRLVLRDSGASRTIAGGTVLDPMAPERHRRRASRMTVLRALAAGEGPGGLLRAPPFLSRRDALVATFGYCPDDIVSLGAFVAEAEPLAGLAQSVRTAVVGHHARRPSDPGLSAEALRLLLPDRLPRDAFAALLGHATERGAIVAEGHLVRLPDHRGGLSGPEAAVWTRLHPILAANRLRPPLLREAATALAIGDVALRRMCKGFARSGLLVEMAPDRFFARDAVIEIAISAHALAAEVGGDGFSAAQFRDRIGCGRQLGIQVLEYFDRRGITVRRGDLRRAGRTVETVLGVQA
jgi:selenocysteine-specific elongation factor